MAKRVFLSIVFALLVTVPAAFWTCFDLDPLGETAAIFGGIVLVLLGAPWNVLFFAGMFKAAQEWEGVFLALVHVVGVVMPCSARVSSLALGVLLWVPSVLGVFVNALLLFLIDSSDRGNERSLRAPRSVADYFLFGWRRDR